MAGPWISQSPVTPDLLSEAGYRICSTGATMTSRSGFEPARAGASFPCPYPQELNDIPQIVGRKLEGDAFADMIVDTFDEMLAEAADRPLVMGIALHGYLVG